MSTGRPEEPSPRQAGAILFSARNVAKAGMRLGSCGPAQAVGTDGRSRSYDGGMLGADPVEVLLAHVDRFNAAVDSGTFTDMVEGFAADAEMSFEGVPVGPFVGRREIAEAYARQPPSDTVLLLGRPRVEGDTVESDYAWTGEGTRAGRMILTTSGEMIERLVVTFE